jgi:hypothetical protein
MENKYYTPNIEEFHVGFEYESYEVSFVQGERWELPEPEWVKKTVLDINNSEYKGKASYHVSINNRYEKDEEWNKYIRVKCLDEFDIIDCGFEKLETKSCKKLKFININKYNRDECIYFEDKVVDGYGKYVAVDNNCGDFYFKGHIKNKSELKKLLEQLGV